MSLARLIALLALAGAAFCQPLHAQEISVAVAANFSAPMKQIAADFERDTGHRVRLAFGSTGQFYAQIRHGAPFSVLLAADVDTPARLERESLGISGSRFTYARGRLALWSKRPGWVDDRGEILRTGQFDKIALANPKLAPYGAAAMEVISRMGLTARLAPRIVEGASVGQAYQFVVTENASLGFVALSQIMDQGRIREGSAWIVPDSLHGPILQDAILLKPGRDQAPAMALLRYLRGETARATMQRFGYE